MNRDTLYSVAIVDISQGATLTLPDAGDRYLSVMIVNNDHYINEVIYDPGEHSSPSTASTPTTCVSRYGPSSTPTIPTDLAAVHALQDQIHVSARSARPFTSPDYDTASLDTTRERAAEPGARPGVFAHTFGSKDAVDPVRHLIGTAAGWGGLPDKEAFYLNVDPGFPPGEYQITVRDVPVDGFWSISVYNADGYFQPNDRNAYSINNITATPNPDGSVTVHFGGCSDDRPNCLPIVDGWNYAVRLYRPRPEILDGTWTFPTAQPA